MQQMHEVLFPLGSSGRKGPIDRLHDRYPVLAVLDTVPISSDSRIFPEIPPGEELFCLARHMVSGWRLWNCRSVGHIQVVYQWVQEKQVVEPPAWFCGKRSDMAALV